MCLEKVLIASNLESHDKLSQCLRLLEISLHCLRQDRRCRATVAKSGRYLNQSGLEATPDQDQPLLAALRPGPSHHITRLTTFADRLREREKPHKVIIIAVAGKIVTIANALCKSCKMWVDQIA